MVGRQYTERGAQQARAAPAEPRAYEHGEKQTNASGAKRVQGPLPSVSVNAPASSLRKGRRRILGVEVLSSTFALQPRTAAGQSHRSVTLKSYSPCAVRPRQYSNVEAPHLKETVRDASLVLHTTIITPFECSYV